MVGVGWRREGVTPSGRGQAVPPQCDASRWLAGAPAWAAAQQLLLFSLTWMVPLVPSRPSSCWPRPARPPPSSCSTCGARAPRSLPPGCAPLHSLDWSCGQAGWQGVKPGEKHLTGRQGTVHAGCLQVCAKWCRAEPHTAHPSAALQRTSCFRSAGRMAGASAAGGAASAAHSWACSLRRSAGRLSSPSLKAARGKEVGQCGPEQEDGAGLSRPGNAARRVAGEVPWEPRRWAGAARSGLPLEQVSPAQHPPPRAHPSPAGCSGQWPPPAAAG